MPWSEWIQSEPQEYDTLATYRAQTGRASLLDGTSASDHYSVNHANLSFDPQHIIYGFLASTPTLLVRRNEHGAEASGSGGVWEGAHEDYQVISWYDDSLFDLTEDGLDYNPPELAALTEGVDYTVRPDRTGSEEDAFIEYEEGTPTLDGWQVGVNLTLTTVTGTNSPAHGTVHALLLDPPPSVPAVPSPFGSTTSGTPIVLDTGSGTIVASIVDGVQGATTGTSLELPPGPFALAAIPGDMTDPLTVVTNEAGTGYSFYNDATRSFGVAGLIAMPRWRYWIPDTLLPLRIRQRGDGLSIETTRLRNRASRQTTNRLRGFD
jgi:hypothetical protein